MRRCRGPEVLYVGKSPFLTLGGGVVSGLGLACFGSAFGGKPEVLDSLLHVGVMAAVVSSACLSMYWPLFHKPPPLFTVVEVKVCCSMKTVITFSYEFLQVGTSLASPATSVSPVCKV